MMVTAGSRVNVDGERLRDFCVLFANGTVDSLSDARYQINEYNKKSQSTANVTIKGTDVYALRDIEPDEDLYVHRGSDYWIRKHLENPETPKMKLLCLMLLTEMFGHDPNQKHFPSCVSDSESAKAFLADFQIEINNPCAEIRRIANSLLTRA